MMQADRRKLLRLRLLARIRSIEHRACAVRASAAVATGERNRTLADRAQVLAKSYPARRDITKAEVLVVQLTIGRQVNLLATNTRLQAEQTQLIAHQLLQHEHEARHRRDRVQEAVVAVEIRAESGLQAGDIGITTRHGINAKLGTSCG